MAIYMAKSDDVAVDNRCEIEIQLTFSEWNHGKIRDSNWTKKISKKFKTECSTFQLFKLSFQIKLGIRQCKISFGFYMFSHNRK